MCIRDRLYTSIGGFRAVAITDTCCAVMMMIGIALLLYYVLEAGGGLSLIHILCEKYSRM